MSIRVRGLLQFIGGAGITFVLALYFQDVIPFSSPIGMLMTLLMTSGGFSLAGLIQFFSGVLFSELGEKWNALAGWQRGVYGTLIFFVVLAVLIGLSMLGIMILYLCLYRI